MAKVATTIRIEAELRASLNKICVRTGDQTYHIEQALRAYGPIKKLTKKAESDAPFPRVPAIVEVDHEILDFCFDQFWNSGIRKVNKKKTKPLFSRVLKEYATEDGPTAYDFTTALVNDVKKRLEINQLGFAEMHPTTYLNGERWNDDKIAPKAIAAPVESFAEKHTNKSWHDEIDARDELLASDEG